MRRSDDIAYRLAPQTALAELSHRALDSHDPEEVRELAVEALTIVLEVEDDVARVSDTFARLGRDEFAILADRTPPAEARALVRRLLDLLADPFAIGEAAWRIGVTSARDGDTVDSLVRRADRNMYRVKRQHHGAMR